jgi:hypothetical protein
MENDERDRPDRQEPEETAAEPAADATEPESDAAEPVTPGEATDSEPSISASEIESWPSQDVAAQTPSAFSTEPPAADSSAADAWPTEPPAAGSADADDWPTTPPERGAEPILEPEPVPSEVEPVPSEVEAYPASAAPTEPVEMPAEEAPIVANAVPSSAGETGEGTVCPRCGTENQAGLSFCRNCGQRLVAAGVATTVDRPAAPEGTMACPRCGTHNRAGVSFCQNCGANLRGSAPGYVPPAVAGEATAQPAGAAERGGAVLGPVVLLIGIVGLVTGYLLPFLFGTGSLFERAFGSGGYGIGFWSSYPDGGLADQAYFGLAAAVPVLAVLLVALAIGGLVRARPGMLQSIGLVIALLWSIGLIVGFVVVELAGNWSGDIVGMLRVLTPAGIILLLASMIVVIGSLTRFGRS